MVHIWALKVMLIPLVITLVLLIVFFIFGGDIFPDPGVRLLAILLPLAVAIAIILLSYTWSFLYRRFYRWQLGYDEVKIWRGIIFRKRITIPHMRIQNVNVVRGPLLLLFGLSGVEVETAGQKGSPQAIYRTEGYIPGIVDGESIADTIVEKVKSAKGREGL